tara:strand:- start:329 stop:682 length:354 start_codon:yes stop_codon:yes gene_type:complete
MKNIFKLLIISSSYSYILSANSSCVSLTSDAGSISNTACIVNEYNGHYYSTGEKITQTSNYTKDESSKIFSCIDNPLEDCETKSKSLINANQSFSVSSSYKDGITDNSFSSRFNFYK